MRSLPPRLSARSGRRRRLRGGERAGCAAATPRRCSRPGPRPQQATQRSQQLDARRAARDQRGRPRPRRGRGARRADRGGRGGSDRRRAPDRDDRRAAGRAARPPRRAAGAGDPPHRRAADHDPPPGRAGAGPARLGPRRRPRPLAARRDHARDPPPHRRASRARSTRSAGLRRQSEQARGRARRQPRQRSASAAPRWRRFESAQRGRSQQLAGLALVGIRPRARVRRGGARAWPGDRHAAQSRGRARRQPGAPARPGAASRRGASPPPVRHHPLFARRSRAGC